MSMHWGWWVVWTAFFLLLGWMAFLSGTGGRGGRGSSPLRESAEERLRQRLARGEIDEAEFEHKMRVIRESREGR